MITSTLKTLALADKMSVPQLQQAVKDGTVPAYIAVPLIQERMKERQQAQVAAAGAQAQQQPPVANQVMAAADQQEAIESLPSGMPAQYAGGGIVAFAEGDLVDDDTDDTDEERDYMNALSGAIALRDARINETPKVKGGISDLTYGDVAGSRLRADRSASTSAYDASGHKYDQLATEYSKEIGLPPSLARYMLHRETGGLKNPEGVVSKAGAIGPAQLMPATAKQLGVDPRNPEQNVMGGIRYLKQMYDKYDGDERLALAAYNAGPGRVDKALKSGQGINALPAETLGYIKMSEGGLAHFAGPDDQVVEDDSSPLSRWWNKINAGSEDYVARENRRAELGPKSGVLGFFKSQTPEQYASANAEESALSRASTQAPATQKPVFPGAAQAEVRRADNALQKQQPEAFKPQAAPEAAPAAQQAAPKVEAETTPKPGPFDQFWEDYKAQKTELGKQKELDKWLGLLNAGLGMMGGTNQNALVNIGQGAMFGAQQYGQARRGTAAEEAALMKAGVLAKRYEGLEDIARGGQELTGARAEAALAEKKREAASQALDRMVKTHTAKVQAKYGKDIMLMDPATKKQYEAEMDSIYTTPRYLELDQIASPASYGNFKYLGPK